MTQKWLNSEVTIMDPETREGITRSAADAFGAARGRSLMDLARRIGELDDLTSDAGTTDIMLFPLDPRAARRWQELARRRSEDWIFVVSTDEKTVLAVDQPSEAGMRDPAAGVIFPELHTRLVSWWLIHAWRSVDLAQDAVYSLGRWRISSAAVAVRALIEEAGCLLVEGTNLAAAWAEVKALPPDPITRPSSVRSKLHPILTRTAIASRLKGTPQDLQATNVLTYVQKLARATRDGRYIEWYDWLSDASHPAFGARVALSSPPIVHGSEAFTSRTYARSPLALQSADGSVEPLSNEVAFYAADALIAAGSVLCDLLAHALHLVDDFGLTTGAAGLTGRLYWRDFKPVKGSRPCPCGRAAWSRCQHRWGQPAPSISVPQAAIPKPASPIM
ncbi:hypothetical protein [Micromonospora sp. ATA51]|uniref:hypothetical protein n=1 Tax=Micromonospora sp. ATA51 TaxID=2806098 RepID=UPI001A594379|nr:hypothetical protein [Micromonospora sp. ATA51]MBM0229238.1 hypothetical protein [Micromonospora sp. ATA51]